MEDNFITDLADTPFPQWVRDGPLNRSPPIMPRPRSGSLSLSRDPSTLPSMSHSSQRALASSQGKVLGQGESNGGYTRIDRKGQEGRGYMEQDMDNDNNSGRRPGQSNILVKVVNQIRLSEQQRQPLVNLNTETDREVNDNNGNNDNDLLGSQGIRPRRGWAMVYKMFKTLVYLFLLANILLVLMIWYKQGGNNVESIRGQSNDNVQKTEMRALEGHLIDRYNYRQPAVDHYVQYKGDLAGARVEATLMLGERQHGHGSDSAWTSLHEVLDKVPVVDDIEDALQAIGDYATSKRWYDTFFNNDSIWALHEARRRLESTRLPISSQLQASSISTTTKSKGDKRETARSVSLAHRTRDIFMTWTDWMYNHTLRRVWWSLWMQRQARRDLADLEKFLLHHRRRLMDEWTATRRVVETVWIDKGMEKCRQFHSYGEWKVGLYDDDSHHKWNQKENGGTRSGSDKYGDGDNGSGGSINNHGICFEMDASVFIDDTGMGNDGHNDDNVGTIATTVWISHATGDKTELSLKRVNAIATTICREIYRWGSDEGRARVTTEIGQRQRAYDMQLQMFDSLIRTVYRLKEEC